MFTEQLNYLLTLNHRKGCIWDYYKSILNGLDPEVITELNGQRVDQDNRNASRETELGSVGVKVVQYSLSFGNNLQLTSQVPLRGSGR